MFLQYFHSLKNGSWQGHVNVPILGFHYDTRLLKPGDCFIALKTDKQDGHDYLLHALKAGAVAAIVERYIPNLDLPQWVTLNPLEDFQNIAKKYRQSLSARIIGLTGSCGKTSTKDLLYYLLGPSDTFRTEGNLNNTLGVPYSLTQIRTEHSYAVIEAGINQFGEMQRLAEMIQPDVACLTTIAPVHLEGLLSLEGIANEKSLLLKSVRSNGRIFLTQEALQYSFINELSVPFYVLVHKDKFFNKIGKGIPLVWKYIRTAEGFELALLSDFINMKSSGDAIFQLPYMSQGMLENTALAIAITLYLGIQQVVIQERLRLWKPSEMRGQVLLRPGQWIYVDCYNANPVSMKDAILAFNEQASVIEPRLYILGGMNELGADAEAYHYQLGQVISLRPQDVVWVTGPYAEVVKTGLIAQGAIDHNVFIFNELNSIQKQFNDFKGSIFIKGSHGFELWKLL